MTYLGVLLMILQTVLTITQKPVVVMTPEQVEHVIEDVVQQVERDQQPEPPPTTAAPDCKQDSPEPKGKR